MAEKTLKNTTEFSFKLLLIKTLWKSGVQSQDAENLFNLIIKCLKRKNLYANADMNFVEIALQIGILKSLVKSKQESFHDILESKRQKDVLIAEYLLRKIKDVPTWTAETALMIGVGIVRSIFIITLEDTRSVKLQTLWIFHEFSFLFVLFL